MLHINKLSKPLIGIVVLLLITGALSLALSKPAQASSCIATFSGARKGLVQDSNGWHHYIEFDVNISAGDTHWSVSGPLWPSMWPGYYNYTHKRAGYSYPSNWPDPYPASSWTLCYH